MTFWETINAPWGIALSWAAGRHGSHNGLVDEQRARHAKGVAKTHPVHVSRTSAQSRRVTGTEALLRIQSSAGNAAAVNLIVRSTHESSRIGWPLPVQREGGNQLDSAHTLTWEVEDESRQRANLVRRTKIEADAWGEVGPHPPRIRFDRTVEFSTSDGRRAHLRITVTVYLKPYEKLPQSPEEALARAGRAVRGGRYFNADGGDLVPARNTQWYDLGARISMQALSGTFPEYAAWPLSAPQQEAAILRHLDGLPRRRPEPKEGRGGGKRGTAAKVAAVITDLAPVIGNIKDAYRFATGLDPDTGERLGWGARILAGIFAIPGLGNALKWIGKPIKWLARTSIVRRAAGALRRRVEKLWKRLTGRKTPKALPSATPRLKSARGHEMLGESLEHLRNAPPDRRIEMFDDFAKQIEEATKGSWSASKSVLQDGTAVFAGSAGHTLVITSKGKVYKGMIQNPGHFSFGKGGVPVPNFANLKELM